MNKQIMNLCFGEEYRTIEVKESDFFTQYFLINNSFILTFYSVSESGIPIDKLQGDIIENIQANLNKDRFQRYEIYIIFILTDESLISIRQRNEIEKDKFCCRKLFFIGTESGLKQFLDERFNLGKDISKFNTNLGGKENEFIKLVNSEILLDVIENDKEIENIEGLCSIIELLKIKMHDKCDNVKDRIRYLRGIEDED